MSDQRQGWHVALTVDFCSTLYLISLPDLLDLIFLLMYVTFAGQMQAFQSCSYRTLNLHHQHEHTLQNSMQSVCKGNLQVFILHTAVPLYSETLFVRKVSSPMSVSLGQHVDQDPIGPYLLAASHV